MNEVPKYTSNGILSVRLDYLVALPPFIGLFLTDLEEAIEKATTYRLSIEARRYGQLIIDRPAASLETTMSAALKRAAGAKDKPTEVDQSGTAIRAALKKNYLFYRLAWQTYSRLSFAAHSYTQSRPAAQSSRRDE